MKILINKGGGLLKGGLSSELETSTVRFFSSVFGSVRSTVRFGLLIFELV